MLKIPAQELIHLPSVGDAEGCKLYAGILGQSLTRSFDEGKIKGYQLLTIKNMNDVQMHFIETDYKSVTNDQFPFLYLFIQPVTNYEELKEIVTGLDLVVL